MRKFRLPSTPCQWLTLAGLLHLLLAVTSFLVGHYQLLPATFAANGLAIGIAADNNTYYRLGLDMVQTLTLQGWSSWMAIPAPLHARLYALCLSLFGGITGYNILAIEPLNLFYYLATLAVVYLLGRTLFNQRAGACAAAIAAVWPSLLLLSAQMVRDPLANLAVVTLVLQLAFVIKKELAWREAGLLLAGLLLNVVILWLARGNMWTIVMVTVVITVMLVLLRIVLERRLLVFNLALIFIFCATALAVPATFESSTLEGNRPPLAALSFQTRDVRLGPFARVIAQIGHRRAAFKHAYTASGSNIDADVSLLSAGDVVRYLPRATVVGLFAPFPIMWFERGTEVGRAGRLVSGGEMIMMYLIYGAVLAGLWGYRRRLEVWFAFSVATVGMIGLGLVVANVGALYRLRYSFWLLLFVIGGAGLQLILGKSCTTFFVKNPEGTSFENRATADDTGQES